MSHRLLAPESVDPAAQCALGRILLSLLAYVGGVTCPAAGTLRAPFDFKTQVVSVRTGQVLALADTPLHVKSKFFCIQDPIEPTDSLGRSLLEPHCRRVQRACREAALAILQSRTADALTVVFGAQNQPARPVSVPPPLPKPTGPAPPPLPGSSSVELSTANRLRKAASGAAAVGDENGSVDTSSTVSVATAAVAVGGGVCSPEEEQENMEESLLLVRQSILKFPIRFASSRCCQYIQLAFEALIFVVFFYFLVVI